MTFDSINQLLHSLVKQSQWPSYQLYLRVLAIWSEVINEEIRNHSNLLGLNQGDLWIEVQSASWANELVLKRYQLLTKLNKQLPSTSQIKDIRIIPPRRAKQSPTDSKEQNPWLNPQMTTCPQCQSMCPMGEVQRWQRCRYGQIKDWQSDQRA